MQKQQKTYWQTWCCHRRSAPSKLHVPVQRMTTGSQSFQSEVTAAMTPEMNRKEHDQFIRERIDRTPLLSKWNNTRQKVCGYLSIRSLGFYNLLYQMGVDSARLPRLRAFDGKTSHQKDRLSSKTLFADNNGIQEANNCLRSHNYRKGKNSTSRLVHPKSTSERYTSQAKAD